MIIHFACENKADKPVNHRYVTALDNQSHNASTADEKLVDDTELVSAEGESVTETEMVANGRSLAEFELAADEKLVDETELVAAEGELFIPNNIIII